MGLYDPFQLLVSPIVTWSYVYRKSIVSFDLRSGFEIPTPEWQWPHNQIGATEFYTNSYNLLGQGLLLHRFIRSEYLSHSDTPARIVWITNLCMLSKWLNRHVNVWIIVTSRSFAMLADKLHETGLLNLVKDYLCWFNMEEYVHRSWPWLCMHPTRWLARFSLIWKCLPLQILNLFRTLSSWESDN